jgi:predicted metalloprotease
MRFNRRARLDPSQVSDQRNRGRGGTIVAGGGLGAVLLTVLALCTGANPASLLATDAPVEASSGDIGNLEQECQVVADIEDNPDCRFVLYVNSTQDSGTRSSPAAVRATSRR